jgi:aminopeptidase N
MEWWGELWLNEGFASYLEFLGANAARPEQAPFDSFYAEDVPGALYFDSKRASHPMSTTSGVNSTAAIEGLFDAVEYERAGAVLRMLRAWANRNNQTAPSSAAAGGWEVRRDATPATDPFLAGLQRHLRARQYGAATAPQLWAALSGPLGLDVAPLMEAWTYAQGYPLLSVSVDGKRGVWLSQAPFALAGTAPCDSSSAWWVPVPYTTSEAPGQVKWAELNACQALRPLLVLPKGGWVKVNAQQYGYFRVDYTPELWAALAAAAATNDVNGFPVLAGVDLAGALEDSYALAEAGDLNITVFLENMRCAGGRRAERGGGEGGGGGGGEGRG